MSKHLEVAGRKSLVLLSGGAYPELAEEIAATMGTEITPTTRRQFANGELFIRPNESVRGTDAFVVQSYTTPINEWLVESLILVDALKRASAKRITVVAPFYPHALPRPPPPPGKKKPRAAGSRSRLGWSPTCSRPPVPTG